MCVIMAADAVRPTRAMIEAGFEVNSAGAGLAWVQGGKVHYRKGLMKVEEIIEAVELAPLPLVCHFRIPTVGGTVKALTHPFEVSKKTDNSLQGATKNYVLFHNGHWGMWKSDCREASMKTGTPLPHGHWSDSRGMAWIASVMGLGMLDFIDEKVVLLGPDGNMIFFGSPWHMVNDVCVSNLGFEHRMRSKERSEKDPPAEPAASTHPMTDWRGVPLTTAEPPRIVHPYKCGCNSCLFKKNSAVRGTGADGPFQEALRNFRQAEILKALPKSDKRRISKNAWKKVRNRLAQETLKVKNDFQRQQALLVLHQGEVTH